MLRSRHLGEAQRVTSGARVAAGEHHLADRGGPRRGFGAPDFVGWSWPARCGESSNNAASGVRRCRPGRRWWRPSNVAVTWCQRPSCGPRWWPSKSPHSSRLISCVGTSFVGFGLAHAVGVAVGDHDVGVVQEPVEQADRGGVFGQEPAPGLEGPVRGGAQGAAFVGGGDEPEQQLGAGVVQGREPDLVDR